MSPHLMMPIGLDTFQQGPHLFIIQLSIHLDLNSIKGTNPLPKICHWIFCIENDDTLKSCLWPVLRPQTWPRLHRVDPPEFWYLSLRWGINVDSHLVLILYCIFYLDQSSPWLPFLWADLLPKSPCNVFKMLRQEVLCARDNVERLRAISAIADLQILISHANQTSVVALEHVGVKGGEHGDEQLGVRSVPWELGRCQALPQVEQALIGQPGGDQHNTPLLVRQQVWYPGVWIFQDSVLAVGILLVIDVRHMVDIQDI